MYLTFISLAVSAIAEMVVSSSTRRSSGFSSLAMMHGSWTYPAKGHKSCRGGVLEQTRPRLTRLWLFLRDLAQSWPRPLRNPLPLRPDSRPRQWVISSFTQANMAGDSSADYCHSCQSASDGIFKWLQSSCEFWLKRGNPSYPMLLTCRRQRSK